MQSSFSKLEGKSGGLCFGERALRLRACVRSVADVPRCPAIIKVCLDHAHIGLDHAWTGLDHVVVAMHAAQPRSHGGAVSSPGTRMYAYGIAPRRHEHVFAALHRSCQVSPKLASSKGDHSKIAPMLICMHVCVYNLDIA